ncbi:MAG: molybdopterin cofactor-binding domain-containing protein, partial [Dehalococcoidia bacterium]
ESHTCAVRLGDDGLLEVWASNKAPHYIKTQIAFTTGHNEGQVRINPAAIGGDFGGKGSQMNVPIAYFLAKTSRRPVRMVMDYTEEFTASNPRHPSVLTVKTGVKRDGTIVACEIVGYFNTGAYAGFVPLGFLPGPRHAVGPYRIPHCQVTAHHVYTNKVPSGHMRGPGEPQAIFAMESHVDVIARTLGLDPVDVRLKNIVREGDANGLGEEFHDLHGVETIESAIEASGYRSPKPAGSANLRYGRGMGIGERTPVGGETHASVAFERDGSVAVRTSIFEQGSGTYTMIQQMVAELLGVSMQQITVEAWDTDSTGFDSGAGASRNTWMASEAVYEAAGKAKEALFRLAAELLSWPEERMVIDSDTLRRSDFDQSIPLGELLARTDIPVEGTADHKDTTPAHVTAFTVQVAEVSIDIETGRVNLLKLTSVHDAGRVLNPQGHDGQIKGGVMQGIGYGLMEELTLRDGRVTTTSFADYKFPNIADIPEILAFSLESSGGVGPFNIKGIGENPLSPVAPAIANAIADAVGIRIRDLPLSAEKVYAAINGPSPQGS